MPQLSPIVVVSGLPRSGTSVMMRMLSAGGVETVTDCGRAPDADNPLGYFEDERVKDLAKDASWIGEVRGKAIKVVSALLRHLPADERYQVIFMRRDLSEIVASQNAMLVRMGKPVGRDDERRLRELFTRHVDATVAQLRRRGEVTLLLVDYHDIILSPWVVAERVGAFLGRALDTEAMTRAVEPALYRQRCK